MPHSSGGGSHSSGSHSGSFSASSSSHGSRSRSTGPIVSDTYRTGYHRYVYYSDHQPVYFYSTQEIKKSDSVLGVIGIILRLICIFIGLAILSLLIGDCYNKPQKLGLSDAEIIIMDRASVLSSEDQLQLESTFREFQQTTGIAPAFLSVENNAWQNNYTGLDVFALDCYVNMFPDEAHWLICYSTDPAAQDFDDWHWEAIQGDDTDSVITERLADRFTQNVQKYLMARSRYTVGQAFNQGFLDIMPGIMDTSFHLDLDSVLAAVFFGGWMIIWPVTGVVKTVKKIKSFAGKAAAVRCPTDQGQLKEDTCAYCGGLYVHGIHLKCPHCSAPIEPLNE